MLASETILEKASDLKAKNIPFVLATVVRSESPTSAKPGAKAIVDAEGTISGWIGGGCAQPAVIATAKKTLADGQPRLIRVSPTKAGKTEEGITVFGMTCHSGGTLDIFIEPYVMRPSLLIIGASPAAQALSGLAERSGFDVYAAFPDADNDIFPDARQVIDDLELVRLDCGTPNFVVVATQGKRDEPGLEAALDTGTSYIAFIASERKAKKLRTYLKERGHDPLRVEAIIAPAGIDIGAVTPEEIALSVLAGLVKERRTAPGIDVAGRAEAAVHAPSIGIETTSEQVAPSVEGDSAVDPVCGMNVEIASAEFRSDYQGHSYYFCCAGCQHSFDKTPERYLSDEGASA